ncbi:DUF3846 domain-containing protein [Frankia sp. ACN1ag]|uniref:DUF3846 domain-containing protein n=1 Tax=Frankia sp. ACN1ag TaxID=102891 RepID=UPI0009F9C027|nr:DUF3846 domain-containing protein [Frankia sp. ACN1ag]
MSALIAGVLLPSEAGRPLEAVTFQADDLSFLRQTVGGDVQTVDLLRPAAALYVREDADRLGAPVNRRATLLRRAANPGRRGEYICGDAILVGPSEENGRITSVPADYSDVLLAENSRFRVEFQPPEGGRHLPLPWPIWPEVFLAYAEGLRIGRALPRQAVRVIPA